jgi:uncharacterized protein (TIGR02271 family)
MSITENRLAIGVFRDRALAEQTVEHLRHAGFRDDEIRVWGQGAATGGFLETLRNKRSNSATEAGSISGSLVELGAPQEEADYYQHEAETGHYIVAVASYGHSQEASDILYRAGAYDAQTSLTHDLHTVPLHEEVLTPHTRSVQVGSIIIRKEVITEEKTITVTVQREEVIIERRPLSPSDTQPGDPGDTLVELAVGETIRIPLRVEQVFIEKRPVVTHELIVGKHTVQETQRFTDTVRREVPRLERQGNVVVPGSGLEESPHEGES